MSLGPVEFALFAFEGETFAGIVPALADLVDEGTVRIIDLVFLRKDAAGVVSVIEASDLPEVASDAWASLDYEVDDLLNADDLALEAEALAPGTAAALVVWENLWSARLAAAVKDAGGVLAESGRVDPSVAEAAMAAYLGNA